MADELDKMKGSGQWSLQSDNAATCNLYWIGSAKEELDMAEDAHASGYYII